MVTAITKVKIKMRSITKKTKLRIPRPLLILGILLLIALTYAATAYAIKLWPFIQTKQIDQGSTKTTQTNDSSKQTTGVPTSSGTNQQETATPTKNTTSNNDASTQPFGDVTITAASQGQNETSDMLYVKAYIAGIKSSGTCTLTLTKGPKVITLPSVGLQSGSSTSTCQGFNISISQQNITTGTWDVSVGVQSGSAKAEAKTTVVIQ